MYSMCECVYDARSARQWESS